MPAPLKNVRNITVKLLLLQQLSTQNQGANVPDPVCLVGDTPFPDKFLPKEKGV